MARKSLEKDDTCVGLARMLYYIYIEAYLFEVPAS